MQMEFFHASEVPWQKSTSFPCTPEKNAPSQNENINVGHSISEVTVKCSFIMQMRCGIPK